MLKTPVELLRDVEAKMTEMEKSVFVRPPPDWETFRQMCGRYLALHEVRTSLLEGIDEGDPRS